MPELTTNDYLERRHRLMTDWDAGGYTLSLIPAQAQWLLHDFYVPSRNLSPEELLAHRKHVTARNRDLPRRAGIAYRLFAEAAARQQVPLSAVESKPGRPLHVHALANPDLNAPKLAAIIARISQQQRDTKPRHDATDGPQRGQDT
jgi:hypothetical protein